MRWSYYSTNLGGNLHDAARIIDQHYPHWDVVAMSYSSHNTVVVYRIERGSAEDSAERTAIAKRRSTGSIG